MAEASTIFHVGFHKTATTWFQTRVYPIVSNASMLPTDTVRELLISPRAFEFDPAATRRALDRVASRPILCHEELSGNIHSAGLHGMLSKEIADRLHRTDPHGHVVIVLRNQFEMVVSAYRQYVRVGGTYRLDRYIHPAGHRPHRAPLFDLGHFDYRLIVEHYIALFGRERVSVFLFEELQQDSVAFLDRFLGRLGLVADPAAIDHRPERAGYGDRTIQLARLLNAFSADELPYKYHLVHIPGSHRLAQRLLDRINQVPEFAHKRPAIELLGADEVRAIHARFGESNDRLASELDLPLAAHGYPLAG